MSFSISSYILPWQAMDAVTDVHVVFSNHLDIGFNVRAWCDGADGCKSPADSHGPSGDLPCRPWAYWVLNENIKTFIPRAIDVADEMRSGDKYVVSEIKQEVIN
jgi:hypothetical protein